MLNVDDTEVGTLINTFKIKNSTLKYYPDSTIETEDHLNDKNIDLILYASWLSWVLLTSAGVQKNLQPTDTRCFRKLLDSTTTPTRQPET